jgi:hypothetical protein
MATQQSAVQKVTGGLSLAQIIIGVAISVGSTLLTVGFAQGSFAQRLTNNEQAVKTEEQDRKTRDAQIVPRVEHEAHWQADEQFRRLLLDKIDSLQVDVREIRAQTSRR